MLPVRLTAFLLGSLLLSISVIAQDSVTVTKKITDTLAAKGKKEMQRILRETGSLKGSVRSVLPGSPVQEGRQLLPGVKQEILSQKDGVLSKVKLFDQVKPVKMKRPVVSAGYNYLKDAASTDSSTFNDLNGSLNYDLSLGASLFELPFDASFRGNNRVYSLNTPSMDKLAHFNFDHKKYLEQLQQKVMEKVSPDKVLASTMDRINAVKKKHEQQLLKEIESLKTSFEKEYHAALQLPDGITDLSQNDMTSLKSKLLSGEGIERANNSAARLQEMLQQGRDPKKDSLAQKDLANVKRLEALQKVYSKITEWKEKFEKNKVVKELRSHLPFTPSGYKTFLKDPANLQKVIGDNAELSGLQRLFMNMTKLDLGQNAVQSGDFDMQNLINTGINTEFKNKKASVGFIYGRNNNVNNWMQSGLANSITNEYSSVTGFKVGTGTGSPVEQSLAVNLYDFKDVMGPDLKDGAQRSSYLGIAPRKEAVITWHSAYSFGGQHRISADVSKSFGSFGNQPSQADQSGAYSKVFSNEGTSNFGGRIDYEGKLLESDVKVFFKKVGLGYNNPGNTLLRRGETQIGIGFSRKVLSQKLTLRLNSDYRNQTFDPAKRYTHNTFNNKLQVSYKIKGNNRVGITYQRSDFRSRLFNDLSSSGANIRWQLDGGYTVRIAGKKIINNATTSHQRFDMPMLADSNYKSNNTMLMHTSTVLLNRNPLSLTILLNKSDNKDYLFNTSVFSAEANYSYALFKAVRLGSGAGYYSNEGWNRQIGIRQQLSATVAEKLNIDLEAGYKKAVHTIRTELADQLFMSATMHLNF